MDIYIPASEMSLLGVKSEYEGKYGNLYKLISNGMGILLCPDKNASIITVNVLYGVGSRNEPPCGATHFLEHLMFKGSKKFNSKLGNDIETLHKQIGARNNATTWLDRTNYFVHALPQFLDLLLEIEADRMRNLEFTQEDRDSEMSVVRNEFERGENNPEEALDKAIWAAAFTEHPYKVTTIGTRAQVENVTVEELMKFYDTFYWPNNAVVILHGNFEPVEALRSISKHFGHIPAQAIPRIMAAEPKQEGERRLKVRRAGDLPIVNISFHVPEAAHKDTYALAIVGELLGSSSKKDSRLYKRLIDSNLAVSINCHSGQNRDPSLFQIVATVAPGKTPEQVEEAILDELEKLKVELVAPRKLRNTKKGIDKGLRLAAVDPQTIMWPVNEDISAVSYEWFDKFTDRIYEVTREQLQLVSREYFTEDNRTVGYFLPKQEEEAPEEVTEVETEESSTPKLVKGLERVTLANGLRLVVVPKPGTGVISIAPTLLNGGSSFNDDANGYASTMVADMLTYGSEGLSKTSLARHLEKMGVTSLDFEAGNFFCSTTSSVVTEDFPQFLSLLSKVICKPLFKQTELKKLREQSIGDLENSRTDEEYLADTVFYQSLYDSEHIYYQYGVDESLSDLKALKRADLVNFYKSNYGPKSTIMVIVGDITAEKAKDLVETHFGSWTGPDLKEITVPAVEPPATSFRKDVFLRDKASAQILVGLPVSLKQSDADYFAASIANYALGGSTIDARLGKVIRVEEGLTYGVTSRFDDLSFGYAPWYITLTVNPENIDVALKFVDTVTRSYVASGIEEKELESEKSRIVGNYYISLSNPATLAFRIAQYEAIGVGAEMVDNFAERLEAVSQDAVNDAIRKYFSLDHAVTIVAGTVPGKQ